MGIVKVMDLYSERGLRLFEKLQEKFSTKAFFEIELKSEVHIHLGWSH
jgi:hypothetical protein